MKFKSVLFFACGLFVPFLMAATYDASRIAEVQAHILDIMGGDTTNNRLLVGEAGTPYNITSKTTSNIKTGAGLLYKVCVNTAGTTDTITIYDNTSAAGSACTGGTACIIATVGALGSGSCVAYNAAFATGLTVVTGGTTAGNYTVTYK